ncbi:MAG: DUF3788 domain-containing protein [Methanomassiliicoccaceae archaeon]|nr:DUF3788 domain-containing protein [Methanomassiliicoccaceae archaeon]
MQYVTGSGKMSLSAFGDKAVKPDEDMVLTVLGERKNLWDRVMGHIASAYKDVSGEWKFYSKDAGWTLVVKSGKRTLVYLIPLEGSFKANFVLGEKAVCAAQGSDLPPHILKAISEARPYAEGRSFMTDVKDDEDRDAVMKLIGIKERN